MDKVVITGLGVISPIGTGVDHFYTALTSGKSGIKKVTQFDTSAFGASIGGIVDESSDYNNLTIGGQAIGRASQFGIYAASMALKDAGLELNESEKQKMAVVIGTTLGEVQILEKIISQKGKENDGSFKSYDTDLIRQYPHWSISQNIARYLGIFGPNLVISNACASGNYALAYAYDLIMSNKVDVAIVGGSDPLSQVAYEGFSITYSLAPERCQPFSKNRKGLVIGEGSGILILEREVTARKRGARIYCELAGYGYGCDAFDMTGPHPEGRGGTAASKMAIQMARVSLEEIDYISAHGTGTPANDSVETVIAKNIFGEDAYKKPMSSIKSMIGHTMGAASAIEAVACSLMFQKRIAPPTINYEEADPKCDLDYIPNVARELNSVNAILSNAYAFGGLGCSILLKKFN